MVRRLADARYIPCSLVCSGCVLAVMGTAFAFVKTMVQTRSRGHTAVGAICYRHGLAATSTLETPVREWPSEAELRAFEETEKRRLADAKKTGKKVQRRRLRPKLLRVDPPRHYDYCGRGGIVGSGAALPKGAAPEWNDPLEWARRVEAADGKRLDSRQCRDDVVGIPLALVESGFADLAIARQAAKLAELHHTPVHWAIHKPHGPGLNWHSHVLYAGRRLSRDGHGFDRRRDTAQDKPELIEDHKRLWAETCREFGVEITFTLPGQAIEDEVREEFTAEHGRLPTAEDEHVVQAEKARRWKEHRGSRETQHPLTATVLRTERDAVAEESGLRLDAVLQAAGGTPLTPHDRRELGRISSGVENLDTAQLLALDRVPVTASARIVKYGRRAPAPSPARQVEPHRPQPAATVGVVAPRPLPQREASLAPLNSLARPVPQPSPVFPMKPSRPQPAATVGVVAPRPLPQREALLAPPNSLERVVPQPSPALQMKPSRPQPAATVGVVAPRPLPQREALLAPPNSLERVVPQPSPALQMKPHRPQPAATVGVVAPRPLPQREALLAPPNSLERVVPQPSPALQMKPSRPQPAATVGVVAPRPLPEREASLAPPNSLARPVPQPSPAVRAMSSARLLSRAGLRGRVPVVPQRIMRPPSPIPRVEEPLAAPAQDERPIAVPELVHPAPEPPWRGRLRRLVRGLRQTVTEWWPWAPTPPRSDRRVTARAPKHLRRRTRPVPARWRPLKAPDGLPRPISAIRAQLLQHPDWHDFDPVTRTVTRNARPREREAPAHASQWSQQIPPVAPPTPASVQTPPDRPRPKRRRRHGGHDGGDR